MSINGLHTSSVNDVSELTLLHLNALQCILGISFIRKSLSAAASDPERELERGQFPGVEITLSKSDFKLSKSIYCFALC